eukprot:gene12735-14040_t
MGLCCSLRRSWKLHLEVVGDEGRIERQPYSVEIFSEGGCGHGAYSLRINKEIRENEIFDNCCSPLCFSGGIHEWEDMGHFFRLELPSLFIRDSLYVDGVEVESKKGNASTWINQFLVYLALGVLILVAGVVLTALAPETVGWSSSRYFGISCLVVGTLTMLPAVIGLARAQNLTIKSRRLKTMQNGYSQQYEDVTQL